MSLFRDVQLLYVLPFALAVLVFLAVLYLVYFLLTLPLRRSERARLFMDVLELGLKEGRTPEAAIVAAASSRDAALGARFHLLAAIIEQGRSLGQALIEVPRLLPPAVVAMLMAGEKAGNTALVLPACRKLLSDSTSQVRGALNYVLLLTLAVTPAMVMIPLIFKVKILPSYLQLFPEMGFLALPAFSRLVFGLDGFLIAWLAFSMLLLWFLLVAYVGGPRFRSWFVRSAVDRLLLLLPWRRKRLQRDFTSILAILLDSGVPEAEAVNLAGAATCNVVFQRRAARVSESLARGTRLATAITGIDNSGELRWRLRNALHHGTGFLQSLSGWHTYLDAKAFQQEQTAAQLLTTGLVLFNGLIVGSMAIAVFLVLINLLNQATLW